MVILNLSFSLLARLVPPDILQALQFAQRGRVKSGNCVSPDTQTTHLAKDHLTTANQPGVWSRSSDHCYVSIYASSNSSELQLLIQWICTRPCVLHTNA